MILSKLTFWFLVINHSSGYAKISTRLLSQIITLLYKILHFSFGMKIDVCFLTVRFIITPNAIAAFIAFFTTCVQSFFSTSACRGQKIAVVNSAKKFRYATPFWHGLGGTKKQQTSINEWTNVPPFPDNSKCTVDILY